MQRGFELSVGDELPTVRELDVRLLDDLIRNIGVVRDPAQERRRQGGDQDRARKGGPERRAELTGRVLKTADFRALIVGTAETVTLPSCEARPPIPSPIRISGTVTIDAVALTSIALMSTTMPITTATNPSSTTRRGEAAGKNLGTPAAASSIANESGVILSPVSIAERPERDRQIQRDHEEQPHHHDELEEEHQQAARHLAVLEQRRCHEGFVTGRVHSPDVRP